MRVLAIDTSQSACDVALLIDGEIAASETQSGGKGQDGRLAIQVQHVLDLAELPLSDVDRFGVVTGPGSFTGTRIGVAFARGLALATGRMALGITSLQAGLPEDTINELSLSLRPAQVKPPQKTWWGQVFEGIHPRSEPFEMDCDALRSAFRDGFGPVYAKPEPEFEDLFILGAAPSLSLATRAAHLTSQLDPALYPPVPAYVRKPDAKPQAVDSDN